MKNMQEFETDKTLNWSLFYFLAQQKIKLAIIFLTAIGIYANTLSHDFALDDQMVIYDNKFVTAGTDSLSQILTRDAFEGFFGERGSQLISGGRYRPLSFVSFALEWKLFGRSPMIGHLLNIITYALLCVCIYIFLYGLFPPKNDDEKWSKFIQLPFLATLFYTLHPLHTEVVANIKGRDELYGFLFAMMTLIYFFQMRKDRLIDLGIIFILFFAALLSKENAITFIIIFPLVALIRNMKWSNKSFYIPFAMTILATISYLILRKISTKTEITAYSTEILNNPFVRANGSEKWGTIIYSFAKYLKLLWIPHPLTHDYYFNQIPYRKLSDPIVLLTAIGIIAMIYLLIRYGKSKKEILFSFLFFGITFSIVSNVIFTVGIIMNERFLFISSLGFCIFLAWLVIHWVKNQKIVLVLSLTILLLYGAKTFTRNLAWKDNFTLFSTDYFTSNQSAKVSTSFGGAMLEKSNDLRKIDSNLAKSYIDSSIQVLKHSIEIYPENSQAWLLYGNAVYARNNNVAEAIDIYKTALQLRPNYFDALYNIGILNYNSNNFDSAAIYLEKTLSVNSAHKESRDLLGKIYARQGKTQEAMQLMGDQKSSLSDLAYNAKEGGNYQEAISLASQALALNPNDAKANFVIGICYGRFLNRLVEAIPYLEKAVHLEPQNGYWAEDLAVAYGMSGQIQKTIPLFEKVISLRPEEAAGYRNLATSYFNLGNKEKANYYMQLANQKTK